VKTRIWSTWFRIRYSGGPIWIRRWTFGCHKRRTLSWQSDKLWTSREEVWISGLLVSQSVNNFLLQELVFSDLAIWFEAQNLIGMSNGRKADMFPFPINRFHYERVCMTADTDWKEIILWWESQSGPARPGQAGRALAGIDNEYWYWYHMFRFIIPDPGRWREQITRFHRYAIADP
jgi:hypothetical protein